MTNHAFCRCLLKSVMEEVRKHFNKEFIKKAWGYKYSNDHHVEFHINSKEPGKQAEFYWYGQGCCVWYAKAEGWMSYMDKMGIDYSKPAEEVE